MAQTAVTAVERVLDILETFQTAERPLSLTELSEMAGIPKSSCHAIVGTLVEGWTARRARRASAAAEKGVEPESFGRDEELRAEAAE